LKKFRKVCRWLHQHLGFLAVGLTLVYGISGIAVNHAHHWDANYQRGVEVFMIEPVGTGPTVDLLPVVVDRVKPTLEIKNSWRMEVDILQLFVEGGQYDVNLLTGEVIYKTFKERTMFYDMNFMHLNTGKSAWTGIADAFAGILIILALTGIFLVRGSKGLKGRGGVLMGLGFFLPLIYIVLERYN